MDPLHLDDLMYRPGLLAGRRVLVTGGGTGLGRTMAEACMMLGATAYICGRRGAVLEETAAALMARHPDGGKVVPLICDIRSSDAIDAMLEAIWADGALDALVNNAAGNFISRTEDLSPNGFDAIANIVFRGSFLMTQGCGRRWLAAGGQGAVVSILTSWIWSGGPFCTASAMSKAGLHVMTQSLAVEWGARGIRLNAICPGAFPTEGMAGRLFPQGLREQKGRLGRSSELANLLIYLIAPGSEFVNGQTLAIDGAAWQAGEQNFAGLRAWGDAEWAAARDAIRATDAADKARRTPIAARPDDA